MHSIVRISNLLVKQPTLRVLYPKALPCTFKQLYTTDSKLPSNFAIERELPEIKDNRKRNVLLALGGVMFWAGVLAVSFNYQKQNTSIVKATLFAAKYNKQAIALLGSDIDFTSSWPWIHGEINHMKGRIDFSYSIKGSKGTGKLVFKSFRRSTEWTPQVFDVHFDEAVVSLLPDQSSLNAIKASLV
ncbi:hypothetical protein DSO57_1016574 [Entomophthora muscae]|uniref:Uncharacterized protein n=1 Tax=Entomophthora muscae TaxID=34485 RepID=A0ACC2RW54_9FUNG|nr:hypothetical protein DSO57_1016574 [Entomophthora muscae]